MILEYRSIATWPDGWQDPNRQREPVRFKASFASTLTLLDRELTMIGADEALVQIDATPNQLTAGGGLRSGAKIDHPGVILTVPASDVGQLTYSCDRFSDRYWRVVSDWQHNLRAIALGLESLRKIERYGIATRGEQYAGFKELGTGIPLGQETAPSMTADEAARLMASAANMKIAAAVIIGDPDTADLLYRMGAKRMHPDAGGTADAMSKLNEARRIVAAAHRQ